MSTNLAEESYFEFIAESQEQCQRVSENLSLMEKGLADDSTLNAIYRDMHTMKGSALLFGYDKIGQVAHALETSLEPIRRLHCKINFDFVDCVYKCIDLIGEMLTDLTPEGAKSNFDNQIYDILPKLVESSSRMFCGEYEIKKDPQGYSLIQDKTELIRDIVETHNENLSDNESIKVESFKSQPQHDETKPQEEIKMNESKNIDNVENTTVLTESTVRVKVDLLDKLMNLVGELVLVRNQVLQYSQKSDDMEFLNLSQNLDIVTSDLQGEVMNTRMQPIGNILSKFQRVIRDMSRDLGKKIDLKLEGTETELDKTLLEAIKDPLTHIIRNSCDHGIETVEERIAAGKNETGLITIRSFHEGGQVIVEVSDDGKGLSREKILSKAIEKNILTSADAEKMSNRDVFNLIFAAGFSTAQKISNVSGRGVGMDVVRTNIEKIGGTVEFHSEQGRGTQMFLKIPLTLAIVPAMIVSTGQKKFAIPQVKLVELVRIENDGHSTAQIEYLHGKPVFRLRGKLLTLLHLDELLGQEVSSKEMLLDESESKDNSINIVVLSTENHCFGLIVDEILDTADIVVKPLSHFLKSISIFSGATIMGDGSVALILDVQAISQKTHQDFKKENSESFSFGNESKVNSVKSSDAQEFLVFRVNAEGKYAIPLCLVNRLEEFSQDQIEYSGNQRVVRYRNSILPLISLNSSLQYEEPKITSNDNNISVIVSQKNNQSFGIQVDQIEDVIVIEDSIDDRLKDRSGIYGNVVCEDEVIVVVDALQVMDQELLRLGASPLEVRESKVSNRPAKSQTKSKILLAEDTPFFRRQLLKILTRAGYEVVTVDDGQKAFEKLQSSSENEYQLILTDIEMPQMTGFELATEVRKLDRYKDISMVAITSRFKENDIKKGKEVGFDLYLEKLDEEKLLTGIESLERAKGA